jgi:hypothetical protein
LLSFDNNARCDYPKLVAVERHHPRGPMWETGTGLKAHRWFIIPLSKRAHDEYHANAEAFEAKHGTHAEILRAFWKEIGFVPGPFMDMGMAPRRAAWLKRVMDRLTVDNSKNRFSAVRRV